MFFRNALSFRIHEPSNSVYMDLQDFTFLDERRAVTSKERRDRYIQQRHMKEIQILEEQLHNRLEQNVEEHKRGSVSSATRLQTREDGFSRWGSSLELRSFSLYASEILTVFVSIFFLDSTAANCAFLRSHELESEHQRRL